ncbi:hypothetical protein Sjap_015278 [Stephania japonica]|uniref:Uncharacterized protein n=1 Tax=Stephania japonica TaxID=461633 RepID=A0AAP0IIT4_9MAGN
MGSLNENLYAMKAVNGELALRNKLQSVKMEKNNLVLVSLYELSLEVVWLHVVTLT